MYENKVNGHVVAGESLSSNMAFYVFSSPTDIRTIAGGGDSASQARLDKLVEVISLKGQPVILGMPYADSGNYVLKFAIEHGATWSTSDLETAVINNQISGMGFDSNISITSSDTM